MKKALLLASCLLVSAGPALAQETPRASEPHQQSLDKEKPSALHSAEPDHGVLFQPTSVASDGSVNVEGRRIDYRAVAGTIVVHPKGWDDAAWREGQLDKDKGDKSDDGDDKNPKAEASMFYVAYFKKGVPSADRPITFLYNGGPGSSTVWLHMGAFGPRRVVTEDHTHTPAAPYALVNNDYSLLDASDLVFVDAPGTGFSRIAGKDKEKAFYGVDADAYAFSRFVQGFLSQYGRWNSPKYLFGESYGTPRSAVLVNELQSDDSIDFNGVILLSQILNFDLDVDGPEANPGMDEPYVVALPTYAATAWYHNRLPGQRPANLEAFLQEVEQFANTDYAQALQQGSDLDPQRKQQIAERLAQYTGLSPAYILKANLRVDGGEFEKNLEDNENVTIGRLDTRFSGPTIDPLSKSSDYDPQSAAISSAYVSAFNSYARDQLRYGQDSSYKPEIDVFKDWDFRHKPPGADEAFPGSTNVLIDLADAMKYNPDLKVMVAGGYFDLATPFYEGWYEMHHLPVQQNLLGNMEFHYYPSGHMVYANQDSLHRLHDDVANFIRRTDNLAGR
jgi:carboxypeptidase C (cathepsin A)